MKTTKRGGKTGFQFAVCVENREYVASLELRKIYALANLFPSMVPEATAALHRQIRIIDESGEDYLYPQRYFVPIELSQVSEKAL
ncbi:MAG TPA: hypothetical protein VJN43_05185 [Bryobacteraceae bacterium]|nr:hypothetical protein [Bryobacteraceae bacterium]